MYYAFHASKFQEDEYIFSKKGTIQRSITHTSRDKNTHSPLDGEYWSEPISLFRMQTCPNPIGRFYGKTVVLKSKST